MNKIPYYFIWSDKYKVFADVLKEGIRKYPDFLEDKSEYIPQSFFDQHLNKAPGHFLTGCFLKLRKTYDILMSLPEDSYFIFSDADVIIVPNNFDNLIKHYIEISADIVFMKEAPDFEFSNVGFSLIKVCEANKELFRNAISKIEYEPTGLDGSFVNEALKSYTGKHYYFPSDTVGTSSTVIYFQKNHPNTFHDFVKNLIVFQVLCDPTQGTDSAIQQKIQQYRMFGVNI
jgi:hypothetical protein